MDGPDSSAINWGQKLANAKPNMEAVWKNLTEKPIGETHEELLLDRIFGVYQRENEHEPFRIVPIRSARDLSEKEIERICVQKGHMFASKLWQMANDFYEEHRSFQGFSCQKIIEMVRQEIKTIIPNDEKACAIYDGCLLEGSVMTFTGLADCLADDIFASLNETERQSTLIETRAFQTESLRTKVTRLPGEDTRLSDDDTILLYIQNTVDRIIENLP